MNQKASPKSGPRGAGTRQSNALGKASRDQIVQAAETVLKRNGYHGLSNRKVADACGISVGNLTYHFPSKALLVEAVMATVCDRYEHQRTALHAGETRSPRSYLRRTITWMLEDAVDADTSALFLELWVLAKHHDFGTEILERFYTTATGWLIKSLDTHFPHASIKKRRSAAYFLLTLSEGSAAVFSRTYQRPVEPREIAEFAVNGVLSILDRVDC